MKMILKEKSKIKSTNLLRVNCAQCGSWEAETIVRTPDFELHTLEEYEVVSCLSCGYIYTAVRPPENILFTKHYPDDYLCYGGKAKSGIDIDTVRRHRQAILRAKILARYLPNEKAKVLEIGCATGEFLKAGKEKYGWEIDGIEPNKKLTKKLIKEGYIVFDKVLEQAKIPSGRYDAVCLFNVFEHLWDAVSSLKRINSFLKPNGLIIIEIPDFEAIGRAVFRRYWFLYHLPRHLTFFTRKTLDYLMRQTGFVPVTICKQFRPTVNAFSIKYWVQEKSFSGNIKKFFSPENPIMLAIAILLELVFNIRGNSNHIVGVYRKIKTVSINHSLLRIRQL